jgi:hypothetical protein
MFDITGLLEGQIRKDQERLREVERRKRSINSCYDEDGKNYASNQRIRQRPHEKPKPIK